MEVANRILQMAGVNNSARSYAWVDATVMTMITALSVYDGQASVFYMIYLFWWNELIALVVGRIFDKIYKREKLIGVGKERSSRLFLLGVYWVFILVFFGLMANWNNTEIMMINFSVLLFKNVFFLANLGFFVLAQCKYNIQHKEQGAEMSVFTPNMVVLHISIILGGVVLFLVVNKFPETFTPDNLWGSVLIIAPFLLLRFFIQLAFAADNDTIKK